MLRIQGMTGPVLEVLPVIKNTLPQGRVGLVFLDAMVFREGGHQPGVGALETASVPKLTYLN